jgi:biopolymer transport protein ExbD
MNNKWIIRSLTFLLLFQFACLPDTRSKIISVDIGPGQLFVEGKPISLPEFEGALREVIGEKERQGLKHDDLEIRLRVDANTRRGDIADLETAMRRLNVRKIFYSVLRPE